MFNYYMPNFDITLSLSHLTLAANIKSYLPIAAQFITSPLTYTVQSFVVILMLEYLLFILLFTNNGRNIIVWK